MDEHLTLSELVNISTELGRESLELVILGEGNTAADCGDGTFWVKASGQELRRIDRSGFCRVRIQPVLDLLEKPDAQDEDIHGSLLGALVESDSPRPSVETFLHALCIAEAGARFVGHTHPVSVKRILCSQQGAEPFMRHIFPDAIVVCGRQPLVVPYTDPGLPLAREVHSGLKGYMKTFHVPPKLILMENHGIVALGQSSRDVVNTTLMADKWARVLLGTFLLDGPNYLPESQVERIDSRADEAFRRKMLASSDRGGGKSG